MESYLHVSNFDVSAKIIDSPDTTFFRKNALTGNCTFPVNFQQFKDELRALAFLCKRWATLWHYRLWSFQGKDTKLERFLAKNQCTQKEFFEV